MGRDLSEMVKELSVAREVMDEEIQRTIRIFNIKVNFAEEKISDNFRKIIEDYPLKKIVEISYHLTYLQSSNKFDIEIDCIWLRSNGWLGNPTYTKPKIIDEFLELEGILYPHPNSNGIIKSFAEKNYVYKIDAQIGKGNREGIL